MNVSRKIKWFFATISVVIAGLVTVVASSKELWESIQSFGLSPNEAINRRLFEVHFREEPVHSKQLVLKDGARQFVLSVDIYQNGDVYISSHNHSQWFPFNGGEHHAASLLNAAYASEYVPFLSGNYKQQTIQTKDSLVRKRIYESGAQEVLTIDPVTGSIKERKQLPPPIRKPEAITSTEETEEAAALMEAPVITDDMTAEEIEKMLEDLPATAAGSSAPIAGNTATAAPPGANTPNTVEEETNWEQIQEVESDTIFIDLDAYKKR